MTMTDDNGNDHNDAEGTHETTQGENPGEQGDIGAGHGDPGSSDPIVGEGTASHPDEQPRQDDVSGAGDDNAEGDHNLGTFGSSDRNADPAI